MIRWVQWKLLRRLQFINSAPPFDDAGIYLQSRYGDETKGTWENGEWLADSTVNDMIEDALGTTDTDERLAKYADIQNYIVDEVCPSAWLCDLSERCALPELLCYLAVL